MNYMKQVAHLLGVELEEEFEINGSDDKYFINEDGIQCVSYTEKTTFPTIMEGILSGKIEIVKIPFKPKDNECYWYWSNECDCYQRNVWCGYNGDYSFWKLGNCFRTKEEAETKGKELMESIVKEYENEN